MREISKASEKSYRIRKIILEVITQPMRACEILEGVKKNVGQNYMVSVSDLKNHLRQLYKSGHLTIDRRFGAPKERSWYSVANKEYNPIIMTGETKERYAQRKLYEQSQESLNQKLAARKEFEARLERPQLSAMRNVSNLADKLKAQQRLINADRHTSIRRSRGGCAGVSQIYEG